MKWPVEQKPVPSNMNFILYFFISVLIITNGIMLIWGSSQYSKGYIEGRNQGQQDKRNGFFYRHEWWVEDSVEYYILLNEMMNERKKLEIDQMIIESYDRAIVDGYGWSTGKSK